MTIRIKLLLLLMLAVAMAILPYSLLSLSRYSKSSLENQRDYLRVLGQVGSAQLNDDYLAYLTNQVMEVLRQKQDFRDQAAMLTQLWDEMADQPAAVRDQILAGLILGLERQKVETLVLRPDGSVLPPYGAGRPEISWPDLIDLAGRRLAAVLSPKSLPREGLTFILSLPAREAGSVPEQHLVLLYPDRARTHTLVFYLPVAAMKAKAMISMESLISQLKRRLAWLPLNAGTSVVLLGSNQKTKLVDHGPQAGVPPAELMLRAAEAGSLEETVEINSTRVMVRIDYLKPMDWYLVMSTPEDQIMEPVEQFVRQIVGLALGCTIIVTVMAILTAFFFTRPIVKLSKFAAQASELDFTSPSAAEFFSIDSFKKSGDELGLLEEALMTLGRTVVAKVNDLLRATQARERLAGELEAARRIQLGFLPSHRQAVLPERCRLAAYLQPAKEVGGDLYDFFPTPDGREALIIGDVSGKGVPAALFMAITVTLIRQTLAEAGLSPAAAMTRINNQLNANNPDSMFVTLFMGLFDPRTGRLEYANGGHCPPLVAEADRVRYIDQFSGPMVGAIEGVVYEGYEDCLRPGQICLLHTDGVTEAQNEQLEFFGKQRLEEILALAPGRDPEEFNRLVVEAIDAFRGPAEPYDDVTLLSFSWEGGE